MTDINRIIELDCCCIVFVDIAIYGKNDFVHIDRVYKQKEAEVQETTFHSFYELL